MKLKVVHTPNYRPINPIPPFEVEVQNLDRGRDALNILAYLDLKYQVHLAQNYGTPEFRDKIIKDYIAYREKLGLLSAENVDHYEQCLMVHIDEWPDDVWVKWGQHV